MENKAQYTLIGAFIIVLSIGFYTGLLFVKETSSANPNGIEEQYLGNENNLPKRKGETDISYSTNQIQFLLLFLSLYLDLPDFHKAHQFP